jgi:ring-1,2-phenylacetyl-CoA epoxidase subunit PaaE
MSFEFYPLRIAEVRRETPEAVSILFDTPPALADKFAFRAGQHLTLRTMFDSEDVRRNYSLHTSPSEAKLRVAIKRIEGGLFSVWANKTLKAGDTIDVMTPHGSFCWDFNAKARRRYVAFAGGSGITPILSLLKTALETEPASQFSLFYGNRVSAGVMFLEELAGLKDRYLDRLQVFHFLEDEDEEILSRLVEPSAVDAYFICGPGPMMDAAEKALTSRGVSKSKILIERFTQGEVSAAQAAAARALEQRAAGLKVSVTLNGRKVNVVFDPAKHSILDNVRASGLPAPFACKGGVCATCRAKVTKGKVEMKVNYGLTEEEVAEGYVLTCQSTPVSEDVAIDYDA